MPPTRPRPSAAAPRTTDPDDHHACAAHRTEPRAAGLARPTCWQRMMSGIDGRSRLYVYLLRRPATFEDADTGVSAVADLGQRKRRAFLATRIQQIETCVAWCYDPKLSTAAAGKRDDRG